MIEARDFRTATLSDADIKAIEACARTARGDVLKMTTLSGSGHPGGSMSSMELYMLLWHCANVDPANPTKPDRDRIVVSHGHTSPGVYATLGRLGFFKVDEAAAHFRQTGSAFAGHIEQCVPGVEWDSGNLGQGMSAAVGFALAREVRGMNWRVFCLMGDGEQQKGQIAEARRTAVKFGLKNLVAFIDLNHLQINGETAKVMPQNIAKNWESDGWTVIAANGHDLRALYAATREGLACGGPAVIIAETVMSKGVSFMENDAHWHGAALPEDKCKTALKELGLPDDLEELKKKRAQSQTMRMADLKPKRAPVTIETGTPRTYGPDDKTDNRSGWGTAIADIAAANADKPTNTPIAVLDCDLKPSVKTDGFAKAQPSRFFQLGIQEHNAATIAGAMSVCGVQTFFADFGVFGVCETYNQHRLSVLNHALPKVVCTHCGLDVGEDGKTHQCVDYVGAFRNLLGFEVIVPADPNQTDRATRYIASSPRPALLVMGRSKLATITRDDGTPYFAGGYTFAYGSADVLRQGDAAAIIVMGTLCGNAVKAHELLKKEGIAARVINVSTPLALDAAAVRAAANTGVIVTVEDHLVTSGLGMSVADFLATERLSCIFRKLGVTAFASSGVPAELYAEYKLDAVGIAGTVRSLVRK